MKETTRLATPENVELEFRLAGPGSRFLALAIDTAICGALYVALIIAILVAGFSFGGKDLASTLVTVFVLVAFFLVRWGYFLFFEIRLRGQTPGKRALGIRVVREGGLPLGVSHSLIRNLLRIVDSLPPPLCIVGAASVLATPKGQRLGDLAAGTVVIRERLRAAKETATGGEQSAGWVTRLEQGRSGTPVLLPHGHVSRAQVALIEEYFRRVDRLDEEGRRSLSWQIARPILHLFDKSVEQWELAADRLELCESILQEVLTLARHSAAGGHDTERAARLPNLRQSPRRPAHGAISTVAARSCSAKDGAPSADCRRRKCGSSLSATGASPPTLPGPSRWAPTAGRWSD